MKTNSRSPESEACTAPGPFHSPLTPAVTVLMLLLALAAAGCERKPARPSADINSFSQIKARFADPPAAFRAAPLWVWNDDVSEEEIDLQMADFKEKGIGGVFVHPRPGLITPYLSDRWFSLFRHAVARGRELGMLVWIYDENSYPSGFAGGHVPADMPESYSAGGGLSMACSDSFPVPPHPSAEVILRREGEGYVDVTADTASHATASHAAASQAGKRGEYLVFTRTYYEKAPWYGGFSYVDLLHDGVTEKFMDLTMHGYEDVARGDFGGVVPGIFTDEPHLYVDGIKWTPRLFERFQERWGYDLRPHLPSLFTDTGDFRRVRHNYYSVLLEMFTDRWARPWHDYCEKHQLQWTGHYWEHAWPNPLFGPDNMAMYQWHQMPAIDVLMNQYSERVDAQFGNVRSVKELRSAANQMGRRRTLSETYGAAGWDLRFEDMKRIADWQYVLGINFVNPHLAYVTIAGARKRDHPQSFSYHEPWWHLYRWIGDYYGRMSLAMSAGEQVNRVVVLEPTTTAWMHFARNGPDSLTRRFGEAFQHFVTQMERRNVEYDLGSEGIIERVGHIDGKRYVIGERTYDLVVLPPALENLNKRTAETLEDYIRAGGRVLSFGIPTDIDGRPNRRFAELAERFGTTWLRADSLADPRALALLASPDFRMVDSAGTGILYHHRRVLSDGELLLLTNTSLTEPSWGSVSMSGHGVLRMDPVGGSIEPFPSSVQGDTVTFSFHVPPGGSLLVFTGKADDTQAVPSPAAPHTETGREVAPSRPMTVERLSANTLPLDYCRLAFADTPVDTPIYFFQAADRIFHHYGLAGNPWSRAVQYKTAILDMDHFEGKPGFIATYAATIDRGTSLAGIRAVVERPTLWEVRVNGTPVNPRQGDWWLDRAFGVYDIGSALRTGANTIALTAPRMTIHTELEPIYLLGDFALTSAPQGWRLSPARQMRPGDWTDQGAPFYSGGVAYKATYTLHKGIGHTLVRLPRWDGSLAQVQVNGTSAGVIASQPYDLDITPFVVDGENAVSVVVYGSLRNLLGPHHLKPPRGSAWPTQFEAAPPKQPAGSEYGVIPCGLTGPFSVVAY